MISAEENLMNIIFGESSSEDKQMYRDIQFNEEKNLVYSFFCEINDILNLNETDYYQIDGINFVFSLYKNDSENVLIEKSNTNVQYKLEYDLKKKCIVSFDFLSNKNIKSKKDFNHGLYFVHEFYNLFIQRKCSSVLTSVYNLLCEKETNSLFFTSRVDNHFFHVKRIAPRCLLLLEISPKGKIYKKIAVKKIEKIPLWFDISSSEDFTCIEKIEREFSIYDIYEDPKRSSEMTMIDLWVIAKKKTVNPSEMTWAEFFIFDFDRNKKNSLLEIPYVVSDNFCPICGKPMLVKDDLYGLCYRCIDFPSCTGIVLNNFFDKNY